MAVYIKNKSWLHLDFLDVNRDIKNLHAEVTAKSYTRPKVIIDHETVFVGKAWPPRIEDGAHHVWFFR